jgi:hypothetical protein
VPTREEESLRLSKRQSNSGPGQSLAATAHAIPSLAPTRGCGCDKRPPLPTRLGPVVGCWREGSGRGEWPAHSMQRAGASARSSNGSRQNLQRPTCRQSHIASISRQAEFSSPDLAGRLGSIAHANEQARLPRELPCLLPSRLLGLFPKSSVRMVLSSDQLRGFRGFWKDFIVGNCGILALLLSTLPSPTNTQPNHN